MQKVMFGKHKGQHWREVPKDYLEWMLRSFKERSRDWYLALAELQRRSDKDSGLAPRIVHVAQVTPRKRSKKRKQRHGAPAPELTGDSWRAPEAPAMEMTQRDALFAQIVNTELREGTTGSVHSVERWKSPLDPPQRKEEGMIGLSGFGRVRGWEWEPNDHVSLERALDDAILRDE